MADYLPHCASCQGLLPVDCRSCAWWQTSGIQRLTPQAAVDRRRSWMTSLEEIWGTTGLTLQGNGSEVTSPADESPEASAPGSAAPTIAASINFAPATAVPRLRDFPFGQLPAASALIFCLVVEEGQPRSQAKRLLHKALAQLKSRGMQDAYAVALSRAKPEDGNACRFFAADFLAANGFEQVTENGGLVLMRADLRGLLSLVDQVETAVRRMLLNEPTPSPAAWTRPGR
jgi:hypothetical protein